MPIFQNTVIQKHLKELPDNEVKPAWVKFTAFFHKRKISGNKNKK